MNVTVRCITVLFSFAAGLNITVAETVNDAKYLYIRDIKTTLYGEKAGTFCEPLDKIILCLNERTGKKWWRSNGSFSLLFGNKGITEPGRGTGLTHQEFFYHSRSEFGIDGTAVFDVPHRLVALHLFQHSQRQAT